MQKEQHFCSIKSFLCRSQMAHTHQNTVCAIPNVVVCGGGGVHHATAAASRSPIRSFVHRPPSCAFYIIYRGCCHWFIYLNVTKYPFPKMAGAPRWSGQPDSTLLSYLPLADRSVHQLTLPTIWNGCMSMVSRRTDVDINMIRHTLYPSIPSVRPSHIFIYIFDDKIK